MPFLFVNLIYLIKIFPQKACNFLTFVRYVIMPDLLCFKSQPCALVLALTHQGSPKISCKCKVSPVDSSADKEPLQEDRKWTNRTSVFLYAQFCYLVMAPDSSFLTQTWRFSSGNSAHQVPGTDMVDVDCSSGSLVNVSLVPAVMGIWGVNQLMGSYFPSLLPLFLSNKRLKIRWNCILHRKLSLEMLRST